MNKELFALIILVALVLVVWFLLWPAIQETIEAGNNLTAWQQKLEETKEAKQKLGNLEEKYKDLQNEEERILKVVPNQEDLPGLLVQLEALASQNGLVLNSLNFTYPQAAKGVATAAAADTDVLKSGQSVAASSQAGTDALSGSLPGNVKILVVALDLAGDYNSLKNFLRAVENNLRLTDVNAINFTEGGSGTGLIMSKNEGSKLSVNLNVYFKK